MRAPLAALALLGMMAVLAGCGGSDRPSARARTATTTTPATTATVARDAPRSRVDRVSSCLTQLGYRLTGGAPQSAGNDAPEYQIILDSRHGGGYIGFYKNEARAKRLATRLRANATRTRGAAVERHGTINIVWVDLPGSAARASVRACLVT